MDLKLCIQNEVQVNELQAISFAFCMVCKNLENIGIGNELGIREPEKSRGQESEFSHRYTQRQPADLEILVSLTFIPSASTANLSLTIMFSGTLPPTYKPGEVASLCASQVAVLGAVPACLLDQLGEIKSVCTLSTHICPEQCLPCVNTQSWLTGSMGPEGEAVMKF